MTVLASIFFTRIHVNSAQKTKRARRHFQKTESLKKARKGIMMKKLGKVPETTEAIEAMTAPRGKNMGHVELTLASYAMTQLMVMCTQPTNNEEKEPHFSAKRIFAIFKSGVREAEGRASEANSEQSDISSAQCL